MPKYRLFPKIRYFRIRYFRKPLYYKQETGIPDAFKTVETVIDYKINPHQWTDYESAQKPLKLDKMALYIFTLLISQLFPFLVFIMENFEYQIRRFMGLMLTKIRRILSHFKKIRIILEKLTLQKILLMLMVVLFATEGLICLWAVMTQFGRFKGFPFGKWKTKLHAILLLLFFWGGCSGQCR